MDREMFNGRFFVPAASLSLFNIFSIVALIPVYDRVFVPLLARFGRKLTLLQRIGVPSAPPIPYTLCPMPWRLSAPTQAQTLVLWGRQARQDLAQTRDRLGGYEPGSKHSNTHTAFPESSNYMPAGDNVTSVY